MSRFDGAAAGVLAASFLAKLVVDGMFRRRLARDGVFPFRHPWRRSPFRLHDVYLDHCQRTQTPPDPILVRSHNASVTGVLVAIVIGAVGPACS